MEPKTEKMGGSEKINVPFAGPVSVFGFMLLGPAVLIRAEECHPNASDLRGGLIPSIDQTPLEREKSVTAV